MSLCVVGHGGAVGALDGRRRGVGGGAGLGGSSGRLSCGGGAVDFVAVGVALRRGAGVDAVGVALSGGLGRPPAFARRLYQILQGDGSCLHIQHNSTDFNRPVVGSTVLGMGTETWCQVGVGTNAYGTTAPWISLLCFGHISCLYSIHFF